VGYIEFLPRARCALSGCMLFGCALHGCVLFGRMLLGNAAALGENGRAHRVAWCGAQRIAGPPVAFQ
jgi:hypothetical protein